MGGAGAPKNISHIFFFEKEKIEREGMFEMGLGGFFSLRKVGLGRKFRLDIAKVAFLLFLFPRWIGHPKEQQHCSVQAPIF